MMGSGKSTLGPRIAAALSWSFIDLDEFIEHRTGMSVARLFTERGEEGFREVESAVLEGVSEMLNRVVALGGGTLLDESNQNIVLRTGLLVYLSLSEDVLFERLSAQKAEVRPLLTDRMPIDRPSPADNDSSADDKLLASQKRTTLETELSLSIVRRLHAQRRPGYQRAHLEVQLGGCTEREALEKILESIASFDGFLPSG